MTPTFKLFPARSPMKPAKVLIHATSHNSSADTDDAADDATPTTGGECSGRVRQGWRGARDTETVMAHPSVVNHARRTIFVAPGAPCDTKRPLCAANVSVCLCLSAPGRRLGGVSAVAAARQRSVSAVAMRRSAAAAVVQWRSVEAGGEQSRRDRSGALYRR